MTPTKVGLKISIDTLKKECDPKKRIGREIDIGRLNASATRN